MKKVRLGKTGLMVSRVGMGGIPLIRRTEDEAVKLGRHALDLGVNFIDTANGYGVSEERIGKGIAGRRDEAIIATKASGRTSADVLNCIETSLKRMQIDYIDLWQFHGVSTIEGFEQITQPGGSIEGAQEAMDAGKIRHIGISSHSLDTAKILVSSGFFETIQFPLNFVTNEAADELVPLALKHDVGFIGMKPFAGGMLTDANLAIKYSLQFDNVVPDPGVEKIEEIEEIVAIAERGSWKLSPEELQKIEEIRAEVGTRFCRRCHYCMPCPQGVDISMMMTMPSLGKLWPLDWFLDEYFVKYTVEPARNCTQCGECEPKCPYKLPIREMIVEHLEFYDNLVQEHT